MKSKYESAITLIALMITIIVLLILAGITISLTMGKNGILERSQQTGLENKKAEIQETIQFAIMEIEMELASNQKGEELNKNLVQKLPNKIQGIIIHEDMTGEYQKYKYYIDEHYNVHILEKIEQSITELALDKKEIIIALTEQKNVNVENTASIRVITENVLPNQYRWHIQEEAIATIDSKETL